MFVYYLLRLYCSDLYYCYCIICFVMVAQFITSKIAQHYLQILLDLRIPAFCNTCISLYDTLHPVVITGVD